MKIVLVKILKKHLPKTVVELIKLKRYRKERGKITAREVFTTINETQFWNSNESVSGGGSELEVTGQLVNELQDLIYRMSIKSILDIPCGDFNWMKTVNLGKTEYIGADIVKNLIKSNTKKYSSILKKFVVLDLSTDNLPTVDLLFCRDCLVHLSYHEIYKSILNIKRSNIKFILLTSFIDYSNNTDILTGGWRKLNFEKHPFNFP